MSAVAGQRTSPSLLVHQLFPPQPVPTHRFVRATVKDPARLPGSVRRGLGPCHSRIRPSHGTAHPPSRASLPVRGRCPVAVALANHLGLAERLRSRY